MWLEPANPQTDGHSCGVFWAEACRQVLAQLSGHTTIPHLQLTPIDCQVAKRIWMRELLDALHRDAKEHPLGQRAALKKQRLERELAFDPPSKHPRQSTEPISLTSDPPVENFDTGFQFQGGSDEWEFDGSPRYQGPEESSAFLSQEDRFQITPRLRPIAPNPPLPVGQQQSAPSLDADHVLPPPVSRQQSPLPPDGDHIPPPPLGQPQSSPSLDADHVSPPPVGQPQSSPPPDADHVPPPADTSHSPKSEDIKKLITPETVVCVWPERIPQPGGLQVVIQHSNSVVHTPEEQPLQQQFWKHCRETLLRIDDWRVEDIVLREPLIGSKVKTHPVPALPHLIQQLDRHHGYYDSRR